MPNNQDIEDITCCLRNRGRSAHRAGWLFFFLAIIVSFVILYSTVLLVSRTHILSSSWYDYGYYEYYKDRYTYETDDPELKKEISLLENAAHKRNDAENALYYQEETAQELLAQLEASDTDAAIRKISSTKEDSKQTFRSTLVASAAFSVVALLLYLLRFLAKISRYHSRLAHHYDLVSDSLVLTGVDNIDKTALLKRSFSNSIE